MGHFLRNILKKSRTPFETKAERASPVSFLYDTVGNRKYLSAAERNAFLEAAKTLPPKGRTLCRALAFTGCRLSEALALTARHIDIDASLVVVECLKKRRRGVFRAIPIPPALLKDLEQVHRVSIARSDPSEIDVPLWPFGRTTAWSHVKKAMAVAQISGARGSPKGLRHAFGVSALQAGVPLNLVKKWLGHSRISTTEIYADAVGEEEQELASRFWKMLG